MTGVPGIRVPISRRHVPISATPADRNGGIRDTITEDRA
jgi:hypothetical protein